MAPSAYLAPLDVGGPVDLTILDAVLDSLDVSTCEVLALTDEGNMATVGCWPKPCGQEQAEYWAWSDRMWTEFLQRVTTRDDTHHNTGDGRTIFPVIEHGILWGALVVSPTPQHPDDIVMALAAYHDWLTDMVRTYS